MRKRQIHRLNKIHNSVSNPRHSIAAAQVLNDIEYFARNVKFCICSDKPPVIISLPENEL